ncbi:MULTISPECIES: hypothetical protein [Nostocaceae]|uniref:hypothetical protein n=1 Tax=Nostocaceae TaxID=1162 RepID=UPI001F558613|nr:MULTISPECIES: hypothetical protein [Nostocaceae]
MSIVVTLSPELEALLRDKAARQGQDVSIVASELLASVLEWEVQESQEAVQGIQKGLDDFDAGSFRSFNELVIERAVSQFSPEELSAFRNWFAEFDAAIWDQKFEKDVQTGKLNNLAQKALEHLRK